MGINTFGLGGGGGNELIRPVKSVNIETSVSKPVINVMTTVDKPIINVTATLDCK